VEFAAFSARTEKHVEAEPEERIGWSRRGFGKVPLCAKRCWSKYTGNREVVIIRGQDRPIKKSVIVGCVV
jgi:hypothetical protein